jgi:hypothetical protein
VVRDDVNREADTVRFPVASATDIDGPDAVPIATLHLIRRVFDEDSSDLVIRLAMERTSGGAPELEVIDAFRTFHDGPDRGSVRASVSRATVSVARWGERVDEYVLPGSF